MDFAIVRLMLKVFGKNHKSISKFQNLGITQATAAQVSAR